MVCATSYQWLLKGSSMQPVYFEGSTEIKKPADMTDEQCMSTWAAAGIDEANFPFFLTAWKPSYEDLQALNRGEPVYIKTVTTRLPPMAVFTLDENGNCNDAG
jgi:hypothetical protein